MDRLRFLSIGSGSSGNCYYIGTGTYGFLVDAGIAVRTIKQELKSHQISMSSIMGVFLTHDHMDHIKSAGVLGENCHIPIYATEKLHDAMLRNPRMEEKIISSRKYFKKGDILNIRDFQIQSFPVSHDATDCVGYTFAYHGQRFTIATDLGFIGKEVNDHICKANYLVIEANYDEEMLRCGKYPVYLKERVKSQVGHLSNTHTAKFLAANWHDDLSYIFLCHLSADNNTPELAYETVHNELNAKQIEPHYLRALKRTQASELYIFK